MDNWFLERLDRVDQDARLHLNILLGKREKLTIGRQTGGDVDIVCNGKTVSREHCVLRYHNNCWSIEDLKSMNGVFINRKRIPAYTPTILQVGDKLGIGAFETIKPDYFVFNVWKHLVKAEIVNNGNMVIGEVPFAANVQPQCDPLEVPEFLSEPLSNEIVKGKTNDIADELGTPDCQNFVSVYHGEMEVPISFVDDLPSLDQYPPILEDTWPTRQGESRILDEARYCNTEKSSISSNLIQLRQDPQQISALAKGKRPSLDDLKLKLNCSVLEKRVPKNFLNGSNAPSKAPRKKLLKGRKRLLAYDSDSDSEENSRKIVNHHAKNSLTGSQSKGKAFKTRVHFEQPSQLHFEDSSEDNFLSTSSVVNKVSKSKFVVEKIFHSKVPDVVYLSSSDEEAFPIDLLDSPILSHADDRRTKSPIMSSHVFSSLSQGSKFFPNNSELSFLDRTEEETTSKNISDQEDALDKLNLLVKSGRFNRRENNTTLQIEPRNLRSPLGRFNQFTTGGGQSQNETDSDEGNQPKRFKSNNDAPPRRKNDKKKLMNTLCKQQGIDLRYVVSVNMAMNKTNRTTRGESDDVEQAQPSQGFKKPRV